jgi:hypothetical protein
MCISYNHILVHLSYHSITKTKQGPFSKLLSGVRHHLANPVRLLAGPRLAGIGHWPPPATALPRRRGHRTSWPRTPLFPLCSWADIRGPSHQAGPAFPRASYRGQFRQRADGSRWAGPLVKGRNNFSFSIII